LITTSKISVFLVHHYYKIRTLKRIKRTSKVSVLSDFQILTIYGVSIYGVLALTNKSLKTF
jgi:hypothetical protein